MMEATPRGGAPREAWPALPLAWWQQTKDTLHLCTQIVGKVKLELCPFLNEWWQVALHPAPRGLTTGPVPYPRGIFAVDFDFVDHTLRIQTSAGDVRAMPLLPRPVGDFYREFLAVLRSLGIAVTIKKPSPDEMGGIPFDEDLEHYAYDRAAVERWWQIMLQTSKVLERYRSPFFGKSSPVHFFWGGFDLAQTRFSGRPSNPPPRGNRLYRLSEDQENISCGFWPGDARLEEPAFYSYTFPKPEGLEAATVRPAAARWDARLDEFILRYEDVRGLPAPEAAILEFFQSTYEAGANRAGWDRAFLEPAVPEVAGRAGAGDTSSPEATS